MNAVASLAEFFSSNLWQLAAWTMVHFLWIGTLIGLATAALRFLLRKTSPNVRYAAMLLSLVALACAPLGVAGWLVQNDSTTPSIVEEQIEENIAPLATVQPSNSQAHQPIAWNQNQPMAGGHPHPVAEPSFSTHNSAQTWGEQTPGFHPIPASQYEPISTTNPPLSFSSVKVSDVQVFGLLGFVVEQLPWIWFIGTPLVFCWLALGLTGAERLRHKSTVIETGRLFQACERLTQELQIRGRVTLATCERIATPVLVGILRPMILVPPAALTGWSPEEIEMVLLHELAHVRRWDNLVNLAQRVVEACLFFHPVVWLVSSWVRQEREACCDAVVVNQTAKPQAYAELLVNLAAAQTPLASVAMARHPLSRRIHTILKLEDPPMLVSRKTVGLIVLAALAAVNVLLWVPSTPSVAQEAVVEQKEEPGEVESVKEGANGKKKTLEGAWFEEREDNPATTVAYDVEGVDKQRVEFVLHDLEKSPYGHKIILEKRWIPEENKISITAPQLTHKRLLQMLFAQLKGNPKIDFETAYVKRKQKQIDNSTPSGNQEPYQTTIHKIQHPVSPEKVMEEVNQLNRLGHNVTVRTASDATYLVTETNANSDPDSPFPTLEEQKMADMAWKMLDLELEKIDDKDLKRVEKLGFAGGLKVTVNSNSQVNFRRDTQHQGQASNSPFWTSPGTPNDIQVGDILVGLHVWPTKNLTDVGKVLMRPDLTELTPLKFYVVRPKSGYGGEKGEFDGFGRGGYGGMSGKPSESTDSLITGRIEVKNIRVPVAVPGQGPFYPGSRGVYIDASQYPGVYSDPQISNQAKGFQIGEPIDPQPTRPVAPVTQGVVPQPTLNLPMPVTKPDASRFQPPPLPGRKAQGPKVGLDHQGPSPGSSKESKLKQTLLYDGKSFDQWCQLWRSELKAEKRIEAIRALAAFGREGLGKEAAEEILNIVRRYEWKQVNHTKTGLLKCAMMGAYTDFGLFVDPDIDSIEPISLDDWLPVLIQELGLGNKRVTQFSEKVMVALLVKAGHNQDVEFRKKVIDSLIQIGPVAAPWLMPLLLDSGELLSLESIANSELDIRKAEIAMIAANILRDITGSDERAINYLESVLGEVKPFPVNTGDIQRAKQMLKRLESRNEGIK